MAEVLGYVTIDGKGRGSFPQDVRKALGLDEGDQFRVERLADGRFELVPVETVPRDQLYFHADGMRERVARAEASFRAGTATRTSGEPETQAFLDSLKAPSNGQSKAR